jgi:2-dehydropantoate 2-reductase
MVVNRNAQIAVAGAGSVGCYAGGRLAAAGRNVTLLLRETLAQAIAQHGLKVSDLEHNDTALAPTALSLETDPAAALRDADVILVTVKAGDTSEMARLIAEHAPKDAAIVSLQNGVDNLPALRRILGPGREVTGGMVPFNVVQTRVAGEAPRFHRASSGRVQIGTGAAGLRDLLDVPGFPVIESPDIEGVLWGKLLLNLNNALNALSGLPLAEEFADRRWRALLARQMAEGLAVLAAAKIGVAPVEGIPPRLVTYVLRFPDWLFRLSARRMLAFDKSARSSMWEDFQAGRKTEVDYIQGAILHLAQANGLSAPLVERVTKLVKQAEAAKKGSPGLTPEEVEGPDPPR